MDSYRIHVLWNGTSFAIPADIATFMVFDITYNSFSGFSFAYIRLYALGVEAFGMEGQIKIAKWREAER